MNTDRLLQRVLLMVGPSVCPVSQESIAGSEELRGTAGVRVHCQSGHPEMGHTGGEIQLLCMD